jgi:hypothetical protein
MPTRSIPWPRIFAEGIAIVPSILLAFDIQAWWEGRQERITVVEHLGSLAAELSSAEAGLRNHVEFLEGQDRTVRDILAVASGSSPSARQLDSLVWVLGPFVSFEPVLPSLRALDVVGISAIESDEVRSAIIRYQDLLATDLEEQDSFSEYWRSEISPYWDELFNIREWIDFAALPGADDAAASWLVPELIADDLPRLSLPVSVDEILSDRRFLNQMSRRIIRSWRIKSRHAQVMEEGAILRLLLLAASS